jgi:hypothetical protein
MKNENIIHACALAALPDIGSDGALPADLQVFPPGKAVKFTLQDYPGKEFEMDVDASVAAKANADLQKLLARASAGEGSKPFADKNHEDAEKTFTPLRYFWGGDDKITGGVRVVPEWTPFGEALVRAKAFGYFSQNFLFSQAKKKFIGLINENVGGLVNRPGFATQAAYAKAAPPTTTNNEENMTKEDKVEIGQLIADAITANNTALEAKAKATEPATAASASADEKLAKLFDDKLKPITEKIVSFEKVQADELKARAKATVGKFVGRVGLAPQDTKAIEFWEASYVGNPALTEELLGKLPARAAGTRFTTSGGGTTTATASTEPEDIFIAKAKAFATENKIENEADALIAFARTSEGAELQDQYRAKVRGLAAK